jgi:hypothetical protein
VQSAKVCKIKQKQKFSDKAIWKKSYSLVCHNTFQRVSDETKFAKLFSLETLNLLSSCKRLNTDWGEGRSGEGGGIPPTFYWRESAKSWAGSMQLPRSSASKLPVTWFKRSVTVQVSKGGCLIFRKSSLFRWFGNDFALKS